MDDKDRTIRIQQNKLEQYEKEKNKPVELMVTSDAKSIETTTCATQTERVSLKSIILEMLLLNFDWFSF